MKTKTIIFGTVPYEYTQLPYGMEFFDIKSEVSRLIASQGENIELENKDTKQYVANMKNNFYKSYFDNVQVIDGTKTQALILPDNLNGLIKAVRVRKDVSGAYINFSHFQSKMNLLVKKNRGIVFDIQGVELDDVWIKLGDTLELYGNESFSVSLNSADSLFRMNIRREPSSDGNKSQIMLVSFMTDNNYYIDNACKYSKELEIFI